MSWGIGDRVGVAVSAGTIATFNSRRPGPVPSLVLDFAGTGTLDPRVTFTRSTTGTYYNSSGVLTTAAINEARFDYNPSTLAPLGLLIEQSSTNTFLYSQDYTNIYWTKSGLSTITGNATTAPDGTITAGLWTSTSNGASLLTSLNNNVAIAAGTYTISIYYKNNTGTFLNIYCSDTGSNYSAAWVNLSTNTVAVTSNGNFSGASGTVTASSNGFYKLNLTFTKPITANSQITIGNLVTASNSFTKYVGSIYLWGAQLEALAFPTNYIPTTSAQVTRASDNASMTGTNFSSWYNTAQGSFYAEAKAIYNISTTGGARYLLANTNTNSYYLYANQNSANITNYDGTNVTQAAVTDFSVFNKFMSTYGSSNKTINNNGLTVVSGSYTQQWANNTGLGIGQSGPSGSLPWNGWIKKVSFYPIQFTSAQQIAITGS